MLFNYVTSRGISTQRRKSVLPPITIIPNALQFLLKWARAKPRFLSLTVDEMRSSRLGTSLLQFLTQH